MGSTPEHVKAEAADAAQEAKTKGGETHLRRWYHPRPQPRCRGDIAGFNYSYWLVAVVLVIIFLLPW
jgi:hypothetical protein